MNINELRALLMQDPNAPFSFKSAGAQFGNPPAPPPPLTFEEFSNGPIGRGQGFMTGPDGRQITFGQQTSDAPMADSGRRSNARPVRVFGDNGRDLGVSVEEPDIDYTKGAVSIPGLGRGYYSKDNASAYVLDPNGGYKKVLIGFNEDAYQAGLDRQMSRDARQAQIDSTREQIAASQANRTRKEMPAAPAGYRWMPDGTLQAIPGGPQDEVQEKRRLENEDRLNARSAIVESGRNTLSQIDELLKHPGFQDAVGATWKPFARLVPGTDAADFSARLDQLKGGAFLEAFKSLKGGGAITEIEGKKAESAITRMSLAQSEAEFAKAANEYKNVVNSALQRMSAGQPNRPVSSAAVARPQSKQDFDALPSGTRFLDPNGIERIKP